MNTTDHCDPDALIRYLDEDLSPERRQKMDGHLQECASCRSELADLKGVVVLTERLPTPGMNRFQAEALVHGVRRGVRQRYNPGWGRWATSLGSAAAGALALLLVLAAFDRLSPAGDPDSGRGLDMVSRKASLGDVGAPVDPGSGAESGETIGGDSSAIEVDSMSDESVTEAAELISDIDEFLMDTASDEELLVQMESLIQEEAVLALRSEY